MTGVQTCALPIFCDDTDVLVLLAHHLHTLHLSAAITMEECSVNRSVVSVNDVVHNHQAIMDNLLSAYVLSGCDTTSGLFGIGTGRILKVLQKFKGTLQAAGDLKADQEEFVGQCDAVVAQVYHNEETSMKGLRGRMWKMKMSNKSIK